MERVRARLPDPDAIDGLEARYVYLPQCMTGSKVPSRDGHGFLVNARNEAVGAIDDAGSMRLERRVTESTCSTSG